MKVIFVYRRKGVGAFSLEELFHAVAVELRGRIEVIEYEAGSRWNVLRDVWRLRSMKADIYHVTGDITYFAMLLPRDKTVLVVPDIRHYLIGLRGIKRWIYKWIWLKGPIHAARAVTALSGETRQSIIDHLGVSEKNIGVIECCHASVFKPLPRPFNSAKPVVLHIGTDNNKNVLRLIEALRGIKCRLALIGRLDAPLRRKLAENNIEYVSHFNLTQEEVYRQYIDCDIVSFVSLGEGFGVPIIEAQACARPLITSNISPMKEAAGNGACLVDPLDVRQIREGILRIIGDSAYRSRLVELGLENVGRYSPSVISAKHYDLFRTMGGAAESKS